MNHTYIILHHNHTFSGIVSVINSHFSSFLVLSMSVLPACFLSLWIIQTSVCQNDFVVETSLVGTVFNGLSHLTGVKERGQFIIGLLSGLGGNLKFKTRQEFAKEVRVHVALYYIYRR